MRHTHAITAACAFAAVVAVLQARGGPQQSFVSWALFSFAVSVFRGPPR